ncbi:peptidyl-tRNA hydrolase [Pirellula staleyi DSM 6068]|uniref:Peptidyl-tRNA hydrolase n=1 Tax=Pirellula staleyi (strain ATCC 27377 / DSM 6068 / ICPB 4128) TaxID=530564 RepID=D2R6N9_PIRSD|nr:aminoacyl-tRNA hydrolase [Pirellula staleyi]ADB17339.1 peptidyl-tRNA hydrolase [Pirellula staleyi DSM 6068]
MKLIVGLGNPGSRYQGTRHNVGFEVVSIVARRVQATAEREQFSGLVSQGNLGPEKMLLLKPTTFMNVSGSSVLAARDFYKIETADILIICDDFALPLGKLRFRAKGSSGGQKGLDDVIRRLGTDAVPRLRVGIGAPPSGWDVANFVLSRFNKDEQIEAEISWQLAADGVQTFVQEGIQACMNKFNAKNV